MLDPHTLGANLRAARERLGLSQQDVSKTIGLPRSAVTNMENGERAVSTIELKDLADLYKVPLLSFFDEDKHDLSVVLLRALPSVMNDDAMKSQVERIRDLCEEGAHLRNLLNLSVEQSLPNYGAGLLGKTASVGDALRQAEHVAAEERRRLGIGNAPIGAISDLLISQGVWTTATTLPGEYSGFFVANSSLGMAIVVNEEHPKVRRRFSFAHECAHALFDREQEVATTTRSNATELAEKRANAFAAAFLMPAEGMKEQLRQLGKGNPSRHAQVFFDEATRMPVETEIRPAAGSQAITYQNVTLIARHFGVSYEAATWRLKSLQAIGNSEAETLLKQRTLGKRFLSALNMFDLDQEDDESAPQQNPCTDETGLERQIAVLALEAYRRDQISLGRLKELGDKLDLDSDLLVTLAQATRPNGQSTHEDHHGQRNRDAGAARGGAISTSEKLQKSARNDGSRLKSDRKTVDHL